MRFLTKLALLGVVLALMAGFVAQTPVVQAQSTGVVTFLNNTSTPLTFSVDDTGYTCSVGVQYGSCSARAAVGGHTLYARHSNGELAASRSIDLDTGGFTWTIYERK